MKKRHVHRFEVEMPTKNQINVVASCKCGKILSMDDINRRLNAPKYRRMGKWADIIMDGLEDATYYIRTP